MSKRITVAGHVCLDITPVFPAAETTDTQAVFTPGRLLHMNGVSVNPGGAVSNTGLGLKVLGADVQLMGKVGKDAFGDMILSIFRKYGLEKGMIVSPGGSTSYSVVLAPPGIDRIFLHDPGANDTYGYDDLDFEAIKGSAVFHFGYPPIMRKMYENSGEELVKIMKAVKGMGIATSLDLAAVDEKSDAGRADWEEILKKVLPYVDFFVPSVEELSFMADRELFRDLKERAGGRDLTLFIREDEILQLGCRLLDWGAKVVLIKCGAPGMYLVTAGKDRLKDVGAGLLPDTGVWSNVRHFEDSYMPEKILSGTGAGDTSISAFLYAVTLGYPWEQCIRLAAATGASCVAAYDAVSGLKPFGELLRKIDGGWKKQNLLLR